MSSGFISEADIAAAKQQRQAEWEKVRLPDQPLEVQEEPYDARSLYERLKEQKDKKDYEFDEAHKLKNLIRGLDDDEVDFLDVIDKAKSVAERKQQQEENNELRDFRIKVASMQEKSLDNKIQAEIAKPKVTKMLTRPSQKTILSGLVVRKRPATMDVKKINGTPSPAKRMCEEGIVNKELVKKDEDIPSKVDASDEAPAKSTTVSSPTKPAVKDENPVIVGELKVGALNCIGILPGVGVSYDSSDSDKSTDTEEDYNYSCYDWLGRKKAQSVSNCQK